MSTKPCTRTTVMKRPVLVEGVVRSLTSLRALVAELSAVVQAKDARIRRLEGQVATLAARVAELEHQQRKDSRTSSKPPSSDPIYAKQPSAPDRSLRQRGQRRVGKQPGAPGATMRLVEHPTARVRCLPQVCAGCRAAARNRAHHS